MNIEQKNILRALGFDTEVKGAKYFLDIVEDITYELLKGTDEESIIEKIPSFCLEYYHFYYEVGKNTFYKELTSFHEKRRTHKNKSFDKTIYESVYKDTKNPSLETSMLAVSKYIVDKKITPEDINQPAMPKLLVK